MTAMPATQHSPSRPPSPGAAATSAATSAATMRAIVQERYGPAAEVLRIRDVPRPEIGDDGVLVRVHAASLNAVDWHLVRGQPFLARLDAGLRRPSQPTPGVDLAGVVEAVGRDVTELAVGDEVFGTRNGSLAEYVAGRVRNFAPKPPNLTLEEAAAIPVAAETALQALRDQGELRAGQSVLVDGAGGGVGIYAVQLAKVLGARVTATTSGAKLAMVRGLGPDEVVDYERVDPTTLGRRFDLVVDVGGFRSNRALGRLVSRDGTIVGVGAGTSRLLPLLGGMLDGVIRSRLLKQRVKFFLARTNRDDLLYLGDLTANGRLRTVIDRVYTLAEVPEAMRYMESGQVAGKLVVTLRG